MTTLIEHAKHELELIGLTKPNGPQDAIDEFGEYCAKCVMQLMEVLSAQGHSGGSIYMTVNTFMKLANLEPLSALTGKDDEWQEIEYDIFEKKVWQNKRYSAVMKEEDGQAYDINAIVYVDEGGTRFMNDSSKAYITFPYLPNTLYLPYLNLNDEADEQ